MSKPIVVIAIENGIIEVKSSESDTAVHVIDHDSGTLNGDKEDYEKYAELLYEDLYGLDCC